MEWHPYGTAFATPGNDTIDAPQRTAGITPRQAGNDTIVGSQGDDLLTSGSGDDSIDGQASNDIIRGDDGINIRCSPGC